jgi:GDP-4-dehydro-6-deoxy-D-mannose reductase
MRVLVTGASGFVGPHVCATLAEAGHDVVAAARRAPHVPGADPVILDVTDPQTIRTALSEVRPQSVVHLAGDAGAGGSWDRLARTMTVNAIGAGNLLAEVAAAVPEARVLLVGTAHQYGGDQGRALRESDPLSPASPYAVSKAAQEMLGAAWAARGLRVVMTRSFNHTGPGAPRSTAAGAFCAQIADIEAGRAPPVIRTGDLSRERDFIDVRDVAGAYRTLLERGEDGQVYNVGSGRARAVSEILRLAVDASSLARDGLTVEEAPGPSGGRTGDPVRLVADIRRVSGLGWQPSIDLQRSIEDTLDSHRAIIAARS